MARKPYDDELNFQDSPEFMMDDVNPLDLGRYAHTIPTEENTDYIDQEISDIASNEMPDEEMGAIEASDDDKLMDQMRQEYGAQAEADISAVDDAPSLDRDSMSRVLASYKELQPQQPKEESELSYDRLALAAAAQKMGQSMAGRYSGNFKPDLEVIKMLQKRRSEEEKAAREKPSRDLKTLLDQYKLKKLMTPAPTEMKVSKDLATADGKPLMMDKYGKKYSMDGQLYEGETTRYEKPLTEAQRLNLEERRAMRQVVADKMTEASKRQERRFEEKDIDRKLRIDDKIFQASEKFERNPIVLELDKQGLSFTQADTLLNSMKEGNEVALGALGTKMARAMGEVGVLTEEDVKRYIQAQSLVRKAQDMYGKNFRGKLSDKTVKDITEVVAKMRDGFSERRNELYERYVKKTYENYGKPAGLSMDDVETRFGFVPRLNKTDAKTPVKKMYSPSANKTKFIYEDGSEEIVDGRQ